MRLRHLAVAIGAIITSQAATALDISVQKVNNDPVVRLDNVIVRGDALKIHKFFEEHKFEQGVQVHLTSRGGQVGEAYKIGQLLRKYNAKVSHSYCAAACVLVYISGVTRITYKSASGSYTTGLMIEPPDDVPKLLLDKSQNARMMLKSLQDYCDSMTGSPRFYNELISTPVGRPRALTNQEAMDYGVTDRIY